MLLLSMQLMHMHYHAFLEGALKRKQRMYINEMLQQRAL
jgi:hypothetical protein